MQIGVNCGSGVSGLSGPFEGDILQYNANNGKWENVPGLWDDLRSPATTGGKVGSSDPVFTIIGATAGGSPFGGLGTYYFRAGKSDELYFNEQMPHSYREGTDIEPHIHFIYAGGTTGTIVWGIEYSWANIGDPFPQVGQSGYGILYGSRAYTAGDQYKHIYLDTIASSPTGGATGNISGTGKKISSMLICRVFRLGSGADTYTGFGGLLEMDFHYQICGMGSATEMAK